MTIDEFRNACLQIPELAQLWEQVLRCALITQTHGLPLALDTHQGKIISEDTHEKYHELKDTFEGAVKRLIKECERHNIEPPELQVSQVCALVQ